MIKTEEEEEGPPPSFPMAKTGNLDVTFVNVVRIDALHPVSQCW